MPQPAQAFAPGSPAGGASIIDKALSGGCPGGLNIPGFTSTSSSRSGDAYQGGSTTGDFSVNFGNGVSQGSGSKSIPSWVWIGLAIAGGVLAWKKFS